MMSGRGIERPGRPPASGKLAAVGVDVESGVDVPAGDRAIVDARDHGPARQGPGGLVPQRCAGELAVLVALDDAGADVGPAGAGALQGRAGGRPEEALPAAESDVRRHLRLAVLHAAGAVTHVLAGGIVATVAGGDVVLQQPALLRDRLEAAADVAQGE